MAPRTACVLAGLLCTPLAWAAEWQPVAGEGTLRFRAVQQGAEFEGLFGRFMASFDLDPRDPSSGRIEAVIDMDSVDTLYDERDEVMRGDEWFHVARWPESRFVTEQIRATDDGFIADATLTMRDVTRPVTMVFTLRDEADGRLRFSAEVPLSRLAFGVGQGQWTNTDWVGDEVTVQVDLLLEPAAP
jgi:polyisoprenoid-binding protein YceI